MKTVVDRKPAKPTLPWLKFASSLVLLFGATGALPACTKGQEAPPPKATPVPPQQPLAPADERYRALPTPSALPSWNPPAVQKRELPSGVSVWHLEQGPLPLVSIHVVLPLGSSSDPKGKEGLTRLTADLLDEGAGARNAIELSDALGTLATDYSASAGIDSVLLSMNALSENFEASMEVLADILLRHRLSSAEFDRRKKHHAAEALAALSDPQSRVRVGLHRVLFGDGYASQPEGGTTASLDRIQLSDVRARAKQLTGASGAHLVFAGQVTAEAIESALAKYFGNWRGQVISPAALAGKPLAPKTAYVIDFPGAAQSSLAVVHPAGDAHDPRYFDELVMNEKFGGSFTGRINMNLREDKGYTYGAFSYLRRYDKAGYFAVQSNVVSEKTAESVKEIFKEVSEFCGQRPLTEQEYREAKDGLLLGYPLEFSRVDSLGTKVASLPIYGRPADFWTTWPDQVRAVGLDAARASAAPYCSLDEYRVVIAGDLAKIRAGLTELGLDLVELNRDGGLKSEP